MANVHPFRPYRYAPQVGDPRNLITQPYDKISPEMQKRYLSLSPYNLVRVILGERYPEDNDSDNVYTRAAKYFEEWITKGILSQDAEPGFYPYFQEFTMPDTGEQLVRKGFIGLGDVVPYSAKIVHRHEQTLSGPKKDRLQVLEHTGAHFGQIFMLYPDREGAVDRVIESAASETPLTEVTDEYGATHRLWKIADAARVEHIRELMRDKKLLIADGHHRYETALAYLEKNPDREAAGRVMMTFVNMYSPGLRILGTHRVLSGLADYDAGRFLAKARDRFTVLEFSGLDGIERLWTEQHEGLIRIGAVLGGGRFAVLETSRDGRLDVPVLHSDILEKMLGIGAEAVRDEQYIRYVRGVEQAAEYVRTGGAQIAFLLEPPSVEQVAEVSFSGGVMPQKSTDFFPKLLTGMTIYKL